MISPNNAIKALFLYFLFSIGTVACTSPDFEDYQYEEVFDCELNPNSEYIVVIGDVQEYTQKKDNSYYFMKTVNWIRGMYKHGYMVNCVMQTGDITNRNQDWQYDVFKEYMTPVAKEVLTTAVTGNHDYDWHNSILSRKSTKFNKYAAFKGTKEKVVATFENGSMENVIIRNTIRGVPFYIIALEFAPRQEVVMWAKQYVEDHQDINFILLTHEFLTQEGNFIVPNQYYKLTEFDDSTTSSPEYVWDNLIYPNDNVRAVICGHNSFSSINNSKKNKTGRTIPLIIFNIQNIENGGNGLVLLWEIPLVGDSINVNVYNTIGNCIYDPMGHSMYKNEVLNYRISIF